MDSLATLAGSSSMGGTGGKRLLCNAKAQHCSRYMLWLPGRARPPPVPSGLLLGTLFFLPCPSIHPSCSVAPAPQQEHQGGQGQHKKEKYLHPPHARNICPQGVCACGHGRFFTGRFSGMGPQMHTQPSPTPPPLPVPVAALPLLGLTCSLPAAAGHSRFLVPARYKTLVPIPDVQEYAESWGRRRTAHPGVTHAWKPVTKQQVLCCSCFPAHVTLQSVASPLGWHTETVTS